MNLKRIIIHNTVEIELRHRLYPELEILSQHRLEIVGH
jgi:hypothetical protein